MSSSSPARLSIEQVGWNLNNSYAQLPETLFVHVPPEEFSQPEVVVLNHDLAETLGLDLHKLELSTAASLFAGQQLPEQAFPIAQAYCGHQFGNFTMLGDGRAHLMGEQRTPTGQLVDLQFKGSGRTPFSRGGDGRAALGPMLREYLISEAMHAVGIPTTRSLAVVTTGERVCREQPLTGAILTRVASSHLRVGTFQYAAARRDHEALRALADFAIDRHDPHLKTEEDRYLKLLEAAVDRQASLIARWQGVGFIHGVMNTDNMAISGETIDYGPCAFMDTYHPTTVFSSIDRGGRYAYGNQPPIAQWNLARFAEALLPLLAEDEEQSVELATEAINAFSQLYERYWLAEMRQKLGLMHDEPDDVQLIEQLLQWMERNQADFTQTFRFLAEQREGELEHTEGEAFQAWRQRWLERLERNGRPLDESLTAMRRYNPAIIPRNYRVEEALSSASNDGDLKPLQNFLQALASPYEVAEEHKCFTELPPDDFGPYRTFCGT